MTKTADGESGKPARRRVRLRLLSYNIQTGISGGTYRQYLTQSWKHILPHRARWENLDNIARLARRFDLVGLQEVDAGSLRSGFVNQIGYLADRGRFPHWYHQTNRSLGRLAQHSIGLLTRLPIVEVGEYRLPGTIPGRGAMVARLGNREEPLVIIIVHLALGKRTRMKQVHFVAGIARDFRHAVLMGDFNCNSEGDEMQLLVEESGFDEPAHGLHTFPSWRPKRNIDHILVSPTIQVEEVAVLNYPFSDHLPMAARISVPAEVLAPAPAQPRPAGRRPRALKT